MADKKKKKKAQADEKFDEAPQSVLERFMMVWKRWPCVHVRRLVLFCEPCLREMSNSKLFENRQFCSELLERGWDIKTTGPTASLDKVYTDSFPDQFQHMKDAYVKKGSRLAVLDHTLKNNKIDWNRLGFYKVIKKVEGGEVMFEVESDQFETKVGLVNCMILPCVVWTWSHPPWKLCFAQPCLYVLGL